MANWRRKPMLALSAGSLVICACMSISHRIAEQRFAEDLKNGGFSICVPCDRDSSKSLKLVVTDDESIEMLLRWFRHRRKPVNHLEAKLLDGFEDVISSAIPVDANLRIEASRFRVEMTFFAVNLESRSDSSGDWKKETWKIQQEDAELRNWAIAHLQSQFRRIEPELRDRMMLDEDAELDVQAINELLNRRTDLEIEHRQ